MRKILFLATFSVIGVVLYGQTAVATFNQSGVLDATYYSSGDEIERVSYFENGKIKEIATFVNMKPEGEWLTFNEAGELIQRGSYQNGKKTGEWIVNCELSKQVFRLLYIGNERIAASEFVATE